MKNLALLSVFLLGWTTTILAQQFKVIGYLPYYRFSLNEQIAYEKLTHLKLAFLNPDTQGNLSIGDQDILPIIMRAKEVNPSIEIFISLAGGALTSEWRAAYDQFLLPNARSGFIHSLIDYVNTHELDGIDVDLEWNDVNEKYSPFVLELKDSLVAHNKQMTAAWPATYRYPDISNEALDAFDFINLMAYDLTGSWAPNNPGPHSPYSFAADGIQYWKNQGVSGDRMTLGVPFYGKDFSNPPSVPAFTYRAIVQEDSAYAWQDQVGMRYWNGIPTIRAKTELALRETAGIMIWELGQDAFGEYSNFSLLSVIDEAVKGIAQNLPFHQALLQTYFYPNPVQDQLYVKYEGIPSKASIALYDLQGRRVWQKGLQLNENTFIGNVRHLPAGMYLAELRIDGVAKRARVLKR